jgi:hypothetical protein
MKYCPECGEEYRDDVATCSDCAVTLVGEAAYRALHPEDFAEAGLPADDLVTVMTAENRFEAERARAALEQEEIPVLVRSFYDTAYDGLFVAQKGWGHIQVRKKDQAAAEEILRDLESTLDAEVSSDPVMVCGACSKEIQEEGEVCPHCGVPLP